MKEQGAIRFKQGDKVEYITVRLNEGFLDELKNIPAEVQEVVHDKSYKSGCGLKIPLWHDPIDSNYFKKL